jgi:3-hydroxybutyryl-CoA dehydrogenase
MFGLHFFMPAHLVPLVEVVCSTASDPARAEVLMAFMRAVGKVPVKVNKDLPGFLANRLQHALMREAFALIDAGVASPEDVDAAVRFGFGFRYLAAGPILQKDYSGLDVHCTTAATIYPSLAANAEPARVLREHVAMGRLGAKAGRGFYDWTPAKTAAEQARYNGLLQAALKLLESELPPLGSD